MAKRRAIQEGTLMKQLSPKACERLLDAVEEGLTPFDYEADDLQGETDCPEGCKVEPDGYCAHGYLSAMETMLRTVA
jgi:hypothetical protein